MNDVFLPFPSLIDRFELKNLLIHILYNHLFIHMYLFSVAIEIQ